MWARIGPALRVLLVGLVVGGASLFTAPSASADAIGIVEARDATASERNGRLAGTTFIWTMLSTVTSPCTSFEVTTSGPSLLGQDAIPITQTVGATVTKYTVWHQPFVLADGYRMTFTIVCVEASGKSAPFVYAYDVGRCNAFLTCSTAARAGNPVVVASSAPVPVTIGSPISVGNFPATQAVTVPTPLPVTGSVSVSNLPATQAVSGSVAVSNLPATQGVSGSVSVSNLPAVQAVSVPTPLPVTLPPGAVPVTALTPLPVTLPSGPVAVSAETALPVLEQQSAQPVALTCGESVAPSPTPTASSPSPSPTSTPTDASECTVALAGHQYLTISLFLGVMLLLALVGFVFRQGVPLTRGH